MTATVWMESTQGNATLRLGPGVSRWTARALDHSSVIHAWPEAPAYSTSGEPLPCACVVAPPGGAEAAAGSVIERLPFPSGGAAALVISLEPGARRPEARAWLVSEGSCTEASVQWVDGRESLQSRNRGLADPDLLAGRCAAVVGLGSGGSAVALELARAGVGRFVLIDFDRLEPSNISRHICGLEALGRLKTLAVRDALLRRNPWARVETVEMNVDDDPCALSRALSAANVVIGATDDRRSRSNINRAAVDLGVTALFGRVLSRGVGGDVLRVRPGQGPCLSCVFGQGLLSGEEEISQRAQARRMAPEYVSDSELGARIQPGLSADIAPVCTMITRLALHELTRSQHGAVESLEDDLAADLYVWANRREGVYAQLPPMGYRFDRSAILRWYGARVARNPRCPACGASADTDDAAFFR